MRAAGSAPATSPGKLGQRRRRRCCRDDGGALGKRLASVRERPGDVGQLDVADARARWSARRSRPVASASGVRAESSSSCGPSVVSEGTRGGGSSRITCALVPPTPNELTPARRGAPSRARASVSSLTVNGEWAKSIVGLGASTCSVAGSRRSLSAQRRLDHAGRAGRHDEMPDVALQRADRAEAAIASVVARKARVRPSISIGSPSGVAVPCVST